MYAPVGLMLCRSGTAEVCDIPLQTLLHNSVLCADTVVNTCVLRDYGSSSLQLSAVNVN